MEDAHEPIVDTETFRRAGEILRGRHGVKNPIEDYVLRGMARCADCGLSMCYYRQQWRRKDGTLVVNPQLSCVQYHQSRRCYFNHVAMDKVEAELYGYLQRVLDGAVAASDLDITFSQLDEIRAEAEDLRRQVAGTDAKFQRQLQAYEAGAIDLADLKAAGTGWPRRRRF